VVPHRGTNWAALWLTSQIGRDAVLSKSYGRGWMLHNLKSLQHPHRHGKGLLAGIGLGQLGSALEVRLG
jgi:hypothetical protein